MDFPHLIDFGVVGLLTFLLLLGVKTAYDFQGQGRSAARKIQRIATTIAIATIAGQSFFGAFCRSTATDYRATARGKIKLTANAAECRADMTDLLDAG